MTTDALLQPPSAAQLPNVRTHPTPLPVRNEAEHPRFMLYSHDGLGLGHFRRNLILAETLTRFRPGASVLLVCSADGHEAFSMPVGVDLLKMPGLRKVGNGNYVSRQLHMQPLSAIGLRAGLLAAVVEHFRPHVMLTDKLPLGVGGELLPALQAQKRLGARSALGLRDVLDDPDSVRREWQDARLDEQVVEYYQRVLIYGMPDMLRPLSPDLLSDEGKDLVRYCGYVVGAVPDGSGSADMPESDGRPLVLATVGGGEDGAAVLHAFLDASSGAAWRGVIVAGPQMSQARWRELKTAAADAGVAALRSVRHVQRWFAAADAIVCMGGYNTLLEAVSSSTPTVCVPRSTPRAEQSIRARAFAAHGLIQFVEPDLLAGPSLRVAIEAAIGTSRASLADRTSATLDIDGAERAASHLLDLAR